MNECSSVSIFHYLLFPQATKQMNAALVVLVIVSHLVTYFSTQMLIMLGHNMAKMLNVSVLAYFRDGQNNV